MFKPVHAFTNSIFIASFQTFISWWFWQRPKFSIAAWVRRHRRHTGAAALDARCADIKITIKCSKSYFAWYNLSLRNSRVSFSALPSSFSRHWLHENVSIIRVFFFSESIAMLSMVAPLTSFGASHAKADTGVTREDRRILKRKRKSCSWSAVRWSKPWHSFCHIYLFFARLFILGALNSEALVRGLCAVRFHSGFRLLFYLQLSCVVNRGLMERVRKCLNLLSFVCFGP